MRANGGIVRKKRGITWERNSQSQATRQTLSGRYTQRIGSRIPSTMERTDLYTIESGELNRLSWASSECPRALKIVRGRAADQASRSAETATLAIQSAIHKWSGAQHSHASTNTHCKQQHTRNVIAQPPAPQSTTKLPWARPTSDAHAPAHRRGDPPGAQGLLEQAPRGRRRCARAGRQRPS